ncbi:peptidylprolyl isomerase [Pedobacter sp. SAFR-022]|uniref:peptidylprolyl isomerase n=1 Tax=Pedobacter sp. SAFR-022 TaxID=3436861 RepID=UPI003F7F5A19
MKNLFLVALLCLSLGSYAAKPKHQYVRISTDKGECIIMLYNQTPLHRDNFLKLAKEKFYNGTLFHRVIQNFMIQGGDPDSRNAKTGAALGEGDVGYQVPAEFRDSLFHKKGVLAAARDNNPEKASSGCQFYIVQGKTYTDEQLDAIETKRLQFKLPESHRAVYKTLGGSPHLDRNYTAFGEVVQGLELVDSIAVLKTDERDRPVTDVKMEVSILRRRQARKLEKALKTSNPLLINKEY